MPSAPGLGQDVEVDRQAGVHQQGDLGPVAGEGRGVAQPGELGAALGAHRHPRLAAPSTTSGRGRR